MSQQLSLETKKRLTEFLGGCIEQRYKVIHPKFRNQTAKSGFTDIDSAREYADSQAKKYPHLGAVVVPYQYGRSFDFFDWRVVGRLVTEAGSLGVRLEIFKAKTCWCCRTTSCGVIYDANSPQLAICLAIDAWLVEKGE